MFQKIQIANQESEESLDLFIQRLMRLVLSSAGLFVFIVDPVQSGFPNKFTYYLLIIYCLYSAVFVFMYKSHLIMELASRRITYWIDTLFFSTLIILTGGVDSIFFTFLFFPILIASFARGFIEGLKVTFTSAFLFTLAGLASGSHFGYDIGQAVIRPVYLIVFGYMIAFWGSGKIVLKHRLQLLQEININWDPRFGSNHAIMACLTRLVKFYQGSRCIIVLDRVKLSPKYLMYVADEGKVNVSNIPKEITETTAKELLGLPASIAVAYNRLTANGMKLFKKYVEYDVNMLDSTDKYFTSCVSLSNLFDNESFISVPYWQSGEISGRIYLIAANQSFNRSDIAFVKQVADVLSSVVENMLLIENVVEDAVGLERHKLSLDVHDTTIQPYIGLTLALDALSREFNEDPHLNEKISEIIHMAKMTIQDLRSYKDHLKEKLLIRGDFLIPAIQKHAERLMRFYGIKVEVEGTINTLAIERLSEPVYQIIKEGLSNILRHTEAKKAFVSIQTTNSYVLIKIGNEIKSNFSEFKSFIPKSIYERVLSLKGETRVENDGFGYTIVHIKIPLSNQLI